MVTQITPSRAKAVPSYSGTDPDPLVNEPPWIQTSTGQGPSGLGAALGAALTAGGSSLGAQTLRLRYS
jgi:hypothetical protein